MRLKNFSSGMRVRLAFSLAIQVDADILLLDEVLAVGDEAFNEKCFEQFRQFKEEGRTVLLVTHSMDSVTRFCDRAVLLDAGRVARAGDPAWVAEGYSELNARLAGERERAQARSAPDRAPQRPHRRGRAFTAAGKPVTYRPSAFGDGLGRLARITVTLAKTEFKLHYRGSVLGYVWSVMQPLLLFGVLYAVFSRVVGADVIEHYPVYVLSAVVLWTYFSEATNGGVSSLVRGEGLLRKMRFPALAIPLSVSLKALFNLAMNSVVVVGFALASGIAPRLSWLELPLLVVLLVVLTTGVTMLLSILYVPLPRHGPDLARRRAGPVLLLADLLRGDPVPRLDPRAGGADPAGGDLQPDAPRVHRPERSQCRRAGRGNGLAAGAGRDLGRDPLARAGDVRTPRAASGGAPLASQGRFPATAEDLHHALSRRPQARTVGPGDECPAG